MLLLAGNIYAQPMVYQESVRQDNEQFTISTPSCVVVEPGRDDVFVISRGMVHIYTSDLFPLYTLSKGNGIENPVGMTLDYEGNLYVSQSQTPTNNRPRITVFNRALMLERDIYLEGFPGAESFAPYQLAADRNGNIYVTTNGQPNAVVIDKNGGFVDMITPTEGDYQVRLNDVAVDSTGRIYLLSDDISRIFVYNSKREFLFKFGKKGGVSGKLSRPRGISVDVQNGLIYVADYMRHSVSAYSYADGEYLFEFGGLGWGDGWFQSPTDVAVDSKGRVLVADTFNNRVEVFQPENLELGAMSSGVEEAPDGG